MVAAALHVSQLHPIERLSFVDLFSKRSTSLMSLGANTSLDAMPLDRLEQRKQQLVVEIARKKRLLGKMEEDERSYLYASMLTPSVSYPTMWLSVG
jgi:hypothetical protein